MRKTHYMMKLLDGYIITNGDDFDYSYFGRKNTSSTNIGIRMTLEWDKEEHSDVRDFSHIGSQDPVAKIDPEFERLLPRIFRGEETPWRLSEVTVFSGGIFLDFINDALSDRKRELERQGRDEEARTICNAIEVNMQISPGVQKRNLGITMRFEVPLPSGLGVSTTIVRIGLWDSLEVIELNANSQRIIEFSESVEDKQNPHDAQSDLVEVTEYSW